MAENVIMNAESMETLYGGLLSFVDEWNYENRTDDSSAEMSNRLRDPAGGLVDRQI
jgi:hypothetical protein